MWRGRCMKWCNGLFFIYKNTITSSFSRIQMRQSRVGIIDEIGAGAPKGQPKRTDRHPSKKVVCLRSSVLQCRRTFVSDDSGSMPIRSFRHFASQNDVLHYRRIPSFRMSYIVNNHVCQIGEIQRIVIFVGCWCRQAFVFQIVFHYGTCIIH